MDLLIYHHHHHHHLFKDYDGDGVINYTEFIAATIEINGKIEEDRVAEAFDRLDVDNSGYISKEVSGSILCFSFFPSIEGFIC